MPSLARQDLINRRFGSLVAIEIAEMRPKGTKGKQTAIWRCQCDCGATSSVARGDLMSGKSKSCGCGRNVSRVANIAIARSAFNDPARRSIVAANQSRGQRMRRERERDRKRGRLMLIKQRKEVTCHV